jgi:hypothetical protein
VLDCGDDSGAFVEARVLAAKSMFAGLAFDEKVLASCLYTHSAPFNEGMVWAMSKPYFGDDLVR